MRKEDVYIRNLWYVSFVYYTGGIINCKNKKITSSQMKKTKT